MMHLYIKAITLCNVIIINVSRTNQEKHPIAVISLLFKIQYLQKLSNISLFAQEIHNILRYLRSLTPTAISDLFK